MNITLPDIIDHEEWLAYLGIKGAPPGELPDQMDRACRELLLAARPKAIYRILPTDSIAMEGFSIRKHLEGCPQTALLAVTLGIGVDQLLTRTQVTDMALAVVMDTGASVLIQQVTDQAEEQMKAELARNFPQTYSTVRFSPGYGDYPLKYQREILNAVDAPRKIGLSLTSGDMMIPHKSITALIGLSEHPVTGRLATCSECVLREKCTFLREGGHC